MTNFSTRPLVSLLCAALTLLTACNQRQNAARAADTTPAPNFPADLQWLNVDKPLTMADLHGKVVVLDFWCFCCINCMHVIPDLKKLEAKYGDEIAIIGVHSAKFTTEKGTDNIRNAILRYEITHPVINDHNFDVWNSYGVDAWPTFVLIDPDGNIVGAHSGEGPFDVLDAPIGNLISRFDAQKKINRTPLALHLEKDKAPPTPLLFPGKITAADGKLFVADSNHNRIVVLAADGTLLETIGDGTEGLKDGNLAEARFFRPQGLAVDGNALYVADTENHSIRLIDLAKKTVTTLVGTGKQAASFNTPGRGTAVALSSPWDVLSHSGKLYIAMAGMHQIWSLNLSTLDAAPFSGSGREEIVDGPLSTAAQAQPSGLSSDGTHLYSADSETSSIRSIDFDPAGSVRTVVGKGLFDFGDVSGSREETRLQHPLGVLYHDGVIYVADTYNNRIKAIDPQSGSSRVLIGNGKAGFADGPAAAAELNEPGGLTFLDGKFYIADTNNHLIRVYDPVSGYVSTLNIGGADKLLPPTKHAPLTGPVVTIAPQEIAAGATSVEVSVKIPVGYKLNTAAPYYFAVTDSSGQTNEQSIVNPSFPIKLPLNVAAGKSDVTVDLIVYYCDAEHESVCLIKRLRYDLPLVGSATAKDKTARLDVVIAKP